MSFVTDDPTALHFSSILIIFAVIALVGIVSFWILIGRKMGKDTI